MAIGRFPSPRTETTPGTSSTGSLWLMSNRQKTYPGKSGVSNSQTRSDHRRRCRTQGKYGSYPLWEREFAAIFSNFDLVRRPYQGCASAVLTAAVPVDTIRLRPAKGPAPSDYRVKGLVLLDLLG